MSDPSALDLEFVVDDRLVGFRLHRLEVLNWGTFDKRVWSYQLDGRNGLLTGEIGSGKSTLVDAITTLLVPPARVSYNKAAGAESRERSLRSYVLGHHRAERNETTGAARSVALRGSSSYSVLLAGFSNAGYGQSVTIAQVFWAREPQGPPARIYVVAERPLSIADDFSGFGNDFTALRKKLRAAGCEVFDSFPAYGAWFRRRFGIENEQALELFHQTVSMKSVGNLTDFVRTHMLEPFDAGKRIDALIAHFDDLDRAHQSVLRTKRQMELLDPLVADGRKHSALDLELSELREGRDALRPYFARHKVDLLDRRLQLLLEESTRLDAQLARLEEQRAAEQTSVNGLERAIRDNGGDRLEQLDIEIRRKDVVKAQQLQKAERFEALLGRIAEPLPKDETSFLDQRQTLTSRADALRSRLAETENARREVEFAFRQGKDEHSALADEIESLTRRKSNVGAGPARLREMMCTALAIAEDELPFVGELIQVREEAREWEGAAERMLHGFALSMLVSEAHYPAVAGWVDRNQLNARLVYFNVRPVRAAQGGSLHGRSLVRKLAVRPGHAHADWLESEMRRRFDVACCDSVEEFSREPRALTRAGQIKDPFGRHEKDDRHRLDDRSRYVLGWSNVEKLRALHQKRLHLEARLGALGARIGDAQRTTDELRGSLETLAALEQFSRFDEIDWMGTARAIAGLTEERTALARASDALTELSRQLNEARERFRALDSRRTDLLGKRGETRHKHEAASELRERASEIAAAPLDALRLERIDRWRAEALGEHQLIVESCDGREQDVRKWIQERMDAAEKRRERLGERIVNAMRGFKEEFKAETVEMDAGVAALGEYERMLDVLRRDDLPRFEARFRELLTVNTINEIANFNAQLTRERDSIRERVTLINRSLEAIDYNRGRYITLLAQPSQDPEIRDFQADLRACTDGALGGLADEQYSEAKFLEVKAIIDRFRGREGLLDADRRWTTKVTDVRNAFLFAASERWRHDGAEHELYVDSSGKSGGQKEKLAYTVLAASLAYQFGLKFDDVRSRSFRFVLIDEAFGRGSDESAQYGLRLFQRLNLQLLIVTPLQKIHIIEPFVSSVAFVHNEGGQDSRLRCLTIEEYRAQKAAAVGGPR